MVLKLDDVQAGAFFALTRYPYRMTVDSRCLDRLTIDKVSFAVCLWFICVAYLSNFDMDMDMHIFSLFCCFSTGILRHCCFLLFFGLAYVLV